MRKHLVDYDDVINTQRDIIYKERSKVLSGTNIKENILEMVEKEVSQTIDNYVYGVSRDQWELENMLKDISSIVPMESNVENSSFMKEMTSDDIEDYFDFENLGLTPDYSTDYIWFTVVSPRKLWDKDLESSTKTILSRYSTTSASKSIYIEMAPILHVK